MGLISFIKGSDNRKHIKKLTAIVDKIDSLASKYEAMSDEELKGMTAEFKRRLNENFETLDDILPEAFAVVREASGRVLGMKHYRVQLMGGVVLHQGRIAEMRTGEGKTLVSTLPAYLNALTGNGVHVVTVNDYLAKRDAEWMGKIHRFLGLTVGIAISGMDSESKRAAYNCDITYATNNELGFDYLRDNMVLYKKDMLLLGFGTVYALSFGSATALRPHHLNKSEHLVGPFVGISLLFIGHWAVRLKILTPKLIYLKSAFIDVKMNVSLLKIRGAGLPDHRLGMKRLHRLPSTKSDPPAMLLGRYEEYLKLVMMCLLIYLQDNSADIPSVNNDTVSLAIR